MLEEEYEQPQNIDDIEQSVIDYVKNLQKHESKDLIILEKFYKKIQPYYDYCYDYTVCKKGCSACCYIHVDVTNIDVAYIDKFMKRKSHTDFNNFIKDPNKETTDENKKCPFLRENCCSIYQVRPFVCRNYLIHPKTEICDMIEDRKEKSNLIYSPNIKYAFHLINERFNKHKGLPNFTIDLKKYYSDINLCE